MGSTRGEDQSFFDFGVLVDSLEIKEANQEDMYTLEFERESYGSRMYVRMLLEHVW